MPEEIKFNQYSAGWCPSDDQVQGRKNALLQMTNLELDENGALTLTGGAGTSLQTYTGSPHTLYSRYINGTRTDYAACSDGSVYRLGTNLASGLSGNEGDDTNAAFATAFNFTLIASGNFRVKDTGTGTPVNLGVGPATIAPTIAVQQPPSITFGETADMVGVEYLTFTASGVSVIGNANAQGQFVCQSYPCTETDTTNFTAPGQSTPYDIFQMIGNINNSGNASTFAAFNFILQGVGFVHFIKVGSITYSYTEVVSDTLANIQTQFQALFTATPSPYLTSELYNQVTNTPDFLVVFLEPNANANGILCTASVEPVPGGSNQPQYLFATLPIVNSFYTNLSLQIDILLVTGDSAGDQVTDYYTWNTTNVAGNPNISLNPLNGQFQLLLQRQQFNRVGNNTALNWSTVYGLRVTFTGYVGQGISFSGPNPASSYFTFTGGSISQNGVYQFAQVNVNNTGSYLALSPLGPPTAPVVLDLTQAEITLQAPTDPQVNEVWVFARSTGQANDYGVVSTLNGWFQVAVLTSNFTLPFFLTFNDEATLELDIEFNLNLVSAASIGISDKIFDILGPLNGRWYYFTTNFFYPSDINDPDLVNVSLGVRICGSSSELYMWARAVAPGVVLVGTSIDIYMLTGTFETLADGTIDVTYLPMGCKFPPITNDCIAYSGNVYYLASDGWRSFSYTGINPYNNFGTAQNTFGFNPILVAPNTDRLYRGDTCYGYSPADLTFAQGSVRFPVAMAQNKLWCFLYGTNRGEVYDFIRQYWRPISISETYASAAFTCQDGQLIVSFGNNLFQINNRTTLAGSIKLLTPVMDNGTPEQRKDCYTLKIRCLATVPEDETLTLSVIDETGTIFPITTDLVSSTLVYQYFDLSIVMTNGLAKTFQISISGSVSAFLLDDIGIIFDTRPIQTTFLRFQSVNYGTASRKRLYSVPFQIDTLGNDVVLTPIVDGVVKSSLTVNCNRKQTFDYQFIANGGDSDLAVIGVDYEWTLAGASLFEFFGFDQPKNVEVFPEPELCRVIPKTNFGSASLKRVRVWPFVLNPRGGEVSFVPFADGVQYPPLTCTGTDKQTFRYYFIEDVNAVDYEAVFTSTSLFEFYEMLSPEIVQTLPIQKQYDKLGPYDMFKYGTVKEIELRLAVIGSGTLLPYEILFNDGSRSQDFLVIKPGIEASYYIPTPKGTSGEVFTITLGPVDNFTFCRYYIRVKCGIRGRDTDNQWVLLPEVPLGMQVPSQQQLR